MRKCKRCGKFGGVPPSNLCKTCSRKVAFVDNAGGKRQAEETNDNDATNERKRLRKKCSVVVETVSDEESLNDVDELVSAAINNSFDDESHSLFQNPGFQRRAILESDEEDAVPSKKRTLRKGTGKKNYCRVRTRAESRQIAEEDDDSDYDDLNSDCDDAESVEQSTDISVELESNEELADLQDTLMVIDTSVDTRGCCNCARVKPSHAEETRPHQITFIRTSLSELKALSKQCRFNLIDFDQWNNSKDKNALVCNECYQYLMAPTAIDRDKNVSWPAFAWSVLKNPQHVSQVWKLVPDTWRPWWKDAIISRFGEYEFQAHIDGNSLFHDVSHEMEMDLDALQNLRWTKDLMEREVSLALPTVKCPVGCCEWKHKASNIPFDIVWECILGVRFKHTMHSSIKAREMRKCTSLFRKDFLIPTRLLNNPNPQWLVKPCISRSTDENGMPMVLSCRHHTTKSRGMMIHPCRSPVGTIASQKANQFCPATCQPRTLQKTKAHAYSANFHMAKLEGNYSGLDTMYLTSNGGFHYYQSRHAWKQEVLAVKGRNDIKGHVHKMIKEKKIEPIFADRFKQDGDAFFPDWDAVRQDAEHGASYMSVDDSLRLYDSIRYEGTETAVLSPDPQGRRKVVSFAGAWPKQIAWVHPAGDKNGRRFPQIMPLLSSKDRSDQQGLWILIAMLTTLPILWYEVATVQKFVESWEGWMLSAVTKHSFPHSGFKINRTNPFSSFAKKNLLTDVFEPDDKEKYNATDVGSKFRPTVDDRFKYSKVAVQYDEFDNLQDNEEKEIIIVLNTKSNESTFLPFEHATSNVHSNWELRFVAITASSTDESNPQQWTGEVFCRHGTAAHPNWWKINRSYDFPIPLTDEWDFGRLPASSLRNWSACVFVRNKSYTHESIRKQVLGACGGQTKIHCGFHNYPLICATTQQKQTSRCNCLQGDLPHPSVGQDDCQESKKRCTHKPKFVCPFEGCKLCICNDHACKVPDNDCTFYVYNDPNKCGYGKHPLHVSEEDSVGSSAPSLLGNSVDSSLATRDNQRAEEIRPSVPLFNARTEADDPLQGLTISFGSAYEEEDAEQDAIHFSAEAEDEFFITGQTSACNEFEFLPHSESLHQEAMQEIPTTNAGTKPIYCVVTNEPYSTNRASNHVLLNQYGSCLIRRNKRQLGTVKNKNFLQGIVATSEGASIPLIYPEATLFTDQFFLDDQNGAVLGALPAAALHDDKVLQRNGLCSLQDHYRTRMSNPALLASANPKYHFFAFDNLVNLGMRGCDSRVILRRGFAEHQGKGGICMRGKKDPIFDTEQVDCRPVVNQLAAAIGDEQPTYFYTHTCSMKTHYGMKLIWEWIMSDEMLDEVCSGDESIQEQEELRQSIIESSGVLLLRTWMEMMQIWIKYITESPEEPCGDIGKFFFRFELQDSEANVPHIHCILWTNDNLKTKEGLDAALDRIRGFIEDILRPEERKQLIEEKVFQDETAAVRFLEMMGTILPHHHLRRCFVVAKNNETGLHEIAVKCKVPNNFQLNPSPSEHTFIPIDVEHTQEAIHVMQTLEVCQPPPPHHKEGMKLEFKPTVDCLQAKKHVPPANGNEGIITPVPGHLIARNPNTCNIQFTTGYLLSRYLAKYVASIDAYNVIKITPPQSDFPNGPYHAEGEMQLNTKITTNKIAQKTTTKDSRNPKERQARAINVMETYMLMFGYDPIIKNIDFEHVPTQPYEERPAKNRQKPLQKMLNSDDEFKKRFNTQNLALSAIDTVACHHVREQKNSTGQNVFPSWRRFTPNQVKKAEDDLQSPLTTDKVTLFGLRPPELRFVMHQDKYARWFKRIPFSKSKLSDQINHCKSHLKQDTLHSMWLDGTCSTIKLRKLAIDEILEYIDNAPDYHFGETPQQQAASQQEIRRHFGTLKNVITYKETGQMPPLCPFQEFEFEHFYYQFVTETNKKFLPVIWHSSIKPTQPVRFLIHLLLSFGAFVDEYTLFSQSSLRQSFIEAKLLNPANPSQSAIDLAKKYLLKQLVYLPAGTRTFDRYITSSYYTIKSFFEDETLYTDEVPTVLYCRLADETKSAMVTYKQNKKKELLQNLLTKLTVPCNGHLPQYDECMSATVSDPVQSWDVTNLPQPTQQPAASHSEQKKLLQLGKNAIDSYISNRTTSTKGVCAVGAGGVGKTTALQMVLLHGMCRGLSAAATSLASERSQELAGEHLNSLLCMPSHQNLTPGQIAERCIANLYRNPEKLEYLRTLDLLLLDETGNIPAELISVLDIVMRYIRNSDKPFGGLLILSTMDNLQIDPPTGKHPLLSSLFISTFNFFRLQECVRAADDANWRRVQEITRLALPDLTKDIEEEFVNLLVTCCSWVENDTDPTIPPNALFVYGKNEPIRQQEQKLFSKLQSDTTINYLVSKAQDHERSIEGMMIQASQATSEALNKKVKEPQELFFFEKGRYQITANEKNKYSNSQLAVLFKMPTQDQIDKKLPIEMLLSPPGSRYIPTEKDTQEDLKKLGWRIEMVHKCQERVTNLHGSIRAMRCQYRLRHHVGSTEHSVMGQTLANLITRVGRNPSPYSLWLPSQVVVLLSRTKYAKDTTFISKNPRETAKILFDALKQQTAFRCYIAYLLDRLCAGSNEGTPEPIAIDQSKCIFRPRDVPLQSDNSGCVYMLLSEKDTNFTYIGSSENVQRRFAEHNRGFGSNQTAPPSLRPWALLAYVVGFDGDKQKYSTFENNWIWRKEQLFSNPSIRPTVESILELATQIIQEYQEKDPCTSLRLIKCGTLGYLRQQAQI